MYLRPTEVLLLFVPHQVRQVQNRSTPMARSQVRVSSISMRAAQDQLCTIRSLLETNWCSRLKQLLVTMTGTLLTEQFLAHHDLTQTPQTVTTCQESHLYWMTRSTTSQPTLIMVPNYGDLTARLLGQQLLRTFSQVRRAAQSRCSVSLVPRSSLVPMMVRMVTNFG